MSDLIPVLVINGEQISEIKYPRFLIPLIFNIVNTKIKNDIILEEHSFVRVKHG